MTALPTFFYQAIAAPPKAALDVQEPIHDYQGSGPQVPPEFFAPEPLYFLGGIPAQLDPLPITPGVPTFTGAFAQTQHYPIWEFPSVSHVWASLSYDVIVLPAFPETVVTLPDATWDGNGQAPEVMVVNVTSSTKEIGIRGAIVDGVQQLINDSPTATINTAYGRMHFFSTGTNWMRVD